MKQSAHIYAVFPSLSHNHTDTWTRVQAYLHTKLIYANTYIESCIAHLHQTITNVYKANYISISYIGGAGIAAGALFIHFFPENAALGVKYGWAFFLFFAGSVIMMLTSFITCFAGILDSDDD